jgi:hypothetical protein
MLGGYREKMEHFYRNIVQRGKMNAGNDEQLLEMLLTHYKSSLVISLDDLAMEKMKRLNTYWTCLEIWW